MREYELITVFNTATDQTLDDAKGKLQEILKRHGVRPAREEDWGERKLYHEIDHIKSGHFIHQTCKAEPTKMLDLKHDMQLEQSIMRFMIKRTASVA